MKWTFPCSCHFLAHAQTLQNQGLNSTLDWRNETARTLDNVYSELIGGKNLEADLEGYMPPKIDSNFDSNFDSNADNFRRF